VAEVEKRYEMSRKRNIWMLSREYRGLAGAGGVQDVARDLSDALADAGYNVTVIMPCYGFINPEKQGFHPLPVSLDVDMNYTGEERREQCGFHERIKGKVRMILIESERFSEKQGIYTYTSRDAARDPSATPGTGYYDYFAMNLLHQKAALALGIYMGSPPDIIHCHDGHTALTPVMMRELEGFRVFYRNTAAVLTIHNAGLGYHQEIADLAFARAVTGLPSFIIYSMLLNGMFDPLLAGSVYATVNTVSENYARELQETELDAITGWLGHALKDRNIRLEGITNGINAAEYTPVNSVKLGIPAGYNPCQGDFMGKDACRRAALELFSGRGENALAREFSDAGMERYGRISPSFPFPLFSVVSRLNNQKGMDILADAMEGPLKDMPDFHLALLGNGEEHLEGRFRDIAGMKEYQGRFVFVSGFNTRLANLIYAAGDFLLIPSRFEPCGLTDLIAQLMGNIPVARKTGGLVKVIDEKTGISFEDLSVTALENAISRAITLYVKSRPSFLEMRKEGCRVATEHYSWEQVVPRYIDLYEKAVSRLAALNR
jgi:starch synthase